MSHREIDFLDVTITLLDEPNSWTFFVTEIDICPNAFDICIRDSFEYVRVFSFIVHCDECIPFLTQPNSQHSIADGDVPVGVVPRQPRYEIPGLVFPGNHHRRVPRQESKPVSIGVLIDFLQILGAYLEVRDCWFVEPSIANLNWSFNAGRLWWRGWWWWGRCKRWFRVLRAFNIESTVAEQHWEWSDFSIIRRVEFILCDVNIIVLIQVMIRWREVDLLSAIFECHESGSSTLFAWVPEVDKMPFG
jgi:hypothetical protein